MHTIHRHFSFHAILLTLAVHCFQITLLQGQQFDSLYRFTLGRDAALLGLGVGTNALSFSLQQGMEPLSIEQISQLNAETVPSFDQDALDNYDATAHTVSNGFLFSSLALPGLLMFDRNIRKDAPRVGLLLAESLALTNGITGMTKRLVKRNRPYMYNPEVPISDKQSINGRFSFFSGHASFSATVSFFTARVWCDYHPDSRLKPVVWSVAATLPAATGYLRYKAGKHFLSDVVTGYAVGALVGYFVPTLHHVNSKRHNQWRFSSSVLNGSPVLVARWRL